jgi:hypothetical protein
MEDIYHEGDITEDVIREWAYCENMWLCEQDEDLVFYDEQLFPLVFDLVQEPKCIKSHDMLGWIADYVNEQNLERRAELINKIKSFVEKSNDEEVSRWFTQLRSKVI